MHCKDSSTSSHGIGTRQASACRSSPQILCPAINATAAASLIFTSAGTAPRARGDEATMMMTMIAARAFDDIPGSTGSRQGGDERRDGSGVAAWSRGKLAVGVGAAQERVGARWGAQSATPTSVTSAAGRGHGLGSARQVPRWSVRKRTRWVEFYFLLL